MLLLRSLLICLVAQGVCLASYFQDPGIPDKEFTLYHAFEKGKVVPIERKITIDNEWYRTEHTDTTGLRVVSLIDRRTLNTVRVDKFRWGKPTLRVVCDSAGIMIEDLQKNKKRRLRHAGPVFDRHTLWEAFRGFPFESKKSVEFPLLVPELGLVSAVVSLDKKEVIDTDSGPIECYKLKMVPTGIIGFLYNKRFYFWFRTISPHLLIFYQDTDGRITKFKKQTG